MSSTETIPTKQLRKGDFIVSGGGAWREVLNVKQLDPNSYEVAIADFPPLKWGSEMTWQVRVPRPNNGADFTGFGDLFRPFG